MYILFQIIFGLGLLILGGELLIRNSSKIAEFYGIPSIVIGLTIVAFGTSAPELFVSIMAGMKGNDTIAVSNVIGSNIFNTLIILGLCGLVRPLVVELRFLKIEIPFLLCISLIIYYFCTNFTLSRIEGSFLLTVFLIYTLTLIKSSKKSNEKKNKQKEKVIFLKEVIPKIFFITLGLGILIYGSEIFITGASSLALLAGVSQRVVALTIVAGGTSLPELVSSLIATKNKKVDMAIGNVIGSNIFNLLAILGISTFTFPNGLKIPKDIYNFDFPVMLLSTLIIFPLLFTNRKLVRWESLLLLAGYIVYIYFLINH